MWIRPPWNGGFSRNISKCQQPPLIRSVSLLGSLERRICQNKLYLIRLWTERGGTDGFVGRTIHLRTLWSTIDNWMWFGVKIVFNHFTKFSCIQQLPRRDVGPVWRCLETLNILWTQTGWFLLKPCSVDVTGGWIPVFLPDFVRIKPRKCS